MEQGGVSEDAVEVSGGKLQCEEILLPDFAVAMLAGHGGKLRGALEADRLVAKRTKRSQVTSRTTTEIEYAKR